MRKRQVINETRADYQRFQQQAYGYLPQFLDAQERFDLAGDIARQMCLKRDRGDEVSLSYLRERCRRRAGEYFVKDSRFMPWESGTEPGGSQGGEVVVQPVPQRRKQMSAPEAAHTAPQAMRRARRTGYRVIGRLTAQESWVAFQQYLSRLPPHARQIMTDIARGVERQETAHRLGRSPGSIANMRTVVKRKWREFAEQPCG